MFCCFLALLVWVDLLTLLGIGLDCVAVCFAFGRLGVGCF